MAQGNRQMGSIGRGIVALCAALGVVAGCSDDATSANPGDAATSDVTTSDVTTGDATDDASAGPSSGNFAMLTYNVHGLPPGITQDDTAGRIAQIAPMLKAWPLIGIQESWIPDNHKVIEAANPHQTKLTFTDKLTADKVYGAGVAFLVDLPLETVVRHHYAKCNGMFDAASDCLASKGVMMARVRLGPAPDCTLDLYVTHFEAGGGKADEAVRTSQVSEVLALMQEQSAGRALIFMGDMNMRPSDPPDKVELDRLAAFGLSDLCGSVGCAEPDHIDRVVFRSGAALTLKATAWAREASFVDDKGVDLSDHPAISGGFDWSCAAP